MKYPFLLIACLLGCAICRGSVDCPAVTDADITQAKMELLSEGHFSYDSRHRYFCSIQNLDVGHVSAFLAAGMPADDTSPDWQLSTLELAIESGLAKQNLSIVRLLRSRGAHTFYDDNGAHLCLLSRAIRSGRRDLLELLLPASSEELECIEIAPYGHVAGPIDLNANTRFYVKDMTALSLALLSHQFELAHVLIHSGANLNGRNYFQKGYGFLDDGNEAVYFHSSVLFYALFAQDSALLDYLSRYIPKLGLEGTVDFVSEVKQSDYYVTLISGSILGILIARDPSAAQAFLTRFRPNVTEHRIWWDYLAAQSRGEDWGEIEFESHFPLKVNYGTLVDPLLQDTSKHSDLRRELLRDVPGLINEPTNVLSSHEAPIHRFCEMPNLNLLKEAIEQFGGNPRLPMDGKICVQLAADGYLSAQSEGEKAQFKAMVDYLSLTKER